MFSTSKQEKEPKHGHQKEPKQKEKNLKEKGTKTKKHNQRNKNKSDVLEYLMDVSQLQSHQIWAKIYKLGRVIIYFCVSWSCWLWQPS